MPRKQEDQITPMLKKAMQSLQLFKGVDLDRVKVKNFTGGQHNHLHRVQIDDLDVAVRIAMKPEKRKGYYSEELHNQRIAAKAGIAPKFLHFNVSNGMMVYPFQVGKKLKASYLKDQDLTKTTLELIRKVHELTPDFTYVHNPIESLKKRMKRNLGKRDGIETKRINRVLPSIDKAIELLEQNPVKNTPIHGDLILDNFILTEKGPILIDWQISGMGDPQEDLATFLWGSDVPVNGIKKYLSYYFKESNPFLESRAVLYLLLVIFYWVLRYERLLIKGTNIAKYEGKQAKRLDEASELLDSPLYWHSQDVLEKAIAKK